MATKTKLNIYMLCPSLLAPRLQKSAKVCRLFKKFNVSSCAALIINNRQLYVHVMAKLEPLGFTVISPFPWISEVLILNWPQFVMLWINSTLCDYKTAMNSCHTSCYVLHKHCQWIESYNFISLLLLKLNVLWAWCIKTMQKKQLKGVQIYKKQMIMFLIPNETFW